MVGRETPQGGCLGSGKRLELDDHREMTWASPPHISAQIPAKKAGSTPGPIRAPQWPNRPPCAETGASRPWPEVLNFLLRKGRQAIESRQATPQTQEAAAEGTGLPVSGGSPEDHQESRESAPQACRRRQQLIPLEPCSGWRTLRGSTTTSTSSKLSS